MQQPFPSRVDIDDEGDLFKVRALVRDAAKALGFSHTDQVRIITAASELARNISRYADYGRVEIDRVVKGGRRGIRIKFEDRGQGIADIELAMSDGYSTSRGLGKGLPGARRLVDEFEIESVEGKGTTVTITKWL